MLMLVDGSAAPSELTLPEPTFYALFCLLRELGTMQMPLQSFVSLVESAHTPEDQLQMLNQFQPSMEIMTQDQWDAAVYTVLDRAAAVTRLMSHHSTQEQCRIRSPVTVLESADAVGQSFDRVTRAVCLGSMQHVKLPTLHTECLLDSAAQQRVAEHLMRALETCTRLA